MKRRHWSRSEEAALMAAAPLGIAATCGRLKRTKPAIRAKAKDMGIALGRSPTGDGGEHARGRMPIPEHCHPLVRRFFEAMNEERALRREVSERSGLSPCAITDWRRKVPRIDNFDAALNTLGLRLEIVEIEERADG